jgi:ABC-2 type transport system ATP-binding protein
VALVAALASDVELLILDEPTSGLDPLMVAMFRQSIAEERKKGRTVLLSSHILAEVEALCDRISIIRSGRIVESGTLTELRHLTRTSLIADVSSQPSGLAALPGVHGVQVEGTRVRLEVDASALNDVLRFLTSFGLQNLISQPPTLEDLFLRHYQTAQPLGSGRSDRQTEVSL